MIDPGHVQALRPTFGGDDRVPAGAVPVLARRDQAADRLHCPHCSSELPSAWTHALAARCPACLLVVGAGRASVEPGGNGNSSAAGLNARRAARADAPAGDPQLIADALRRAAAQLGQSTRRLRMSDYLELQHDDPTLPELEVVLATFPAGKPPEANAPRRAS